MAEEIAENGCGAEADVAEAGEAQPDAKRQRVDGLGPLQLLAVGFCGVDESVDPARLVEISKRAPWAEWGVLFRPGKDSTPRFPGAEWVDKLSAAVKEARAAGHTVRLAAHLCSSRCDAVLNGDASFVAKLVELGFNRAQVNATAANGVDTSRLAEQVGSTTASIKSVQDIEWILQRNSETLPVFGPILEDKELGNICVLFDDSVGTGVEVKTFTSPSALEGVPCGYAGGIGPKNIRKILETMRASVGADFATGKYRAPWIDMESSLRAQVDGEDIFDPALVEQCIVCVEQARADGLVSFAPADASNPSSEQ